MPRDASGNYTLPAGNPVVGGTIITANWANPTMDDIGNELTNSLDREGRGGMLVAFKNIDGSVSAPGITWTNEPTSGFFREGTAEMRQSTLGIPTTRWIDATGQTVGQQKPFEIWDGEAWAAPAVLTGADLIVAGDFIVAGDVQFQKDFGMSWFDLTVAPGVYTRLIDFDDTNEELFVGIDPLEANVGTVLQGGGSFLTLRAGGSSLNSKLKLILTSESGSDIEMNAFGANIHIFSGGLKVADLAGTGTRNVVVDAAGLMSAP